jgi:hypothetical protein
LPVLAWGAPGDHIRAGEATIIPSVELGIEHTTNAYRAESDVRGGTDVLVTPSVEILAEGGDIEFSLDGAWELRKYFQSRLSNLDRFTDFHIGADLLLLKQQAVSFRLNEDAALKNREVTRPFAGSAYNTQFRNRFDGALVVNAGPVLRFDLGGFWGYDDFLVQDFTTQGLRPFNFRNAFGPTVDAEWAFLPRTAVVADFEYGFYRWNEHWVPTSNAQSELGSFIGLPDSRAWKTRLGLRGRMTERLVLLLQLGYGQAGYDEQTVIDDGGGGEDPDAIATDLRGFTGLLFTGQVTWAMAPEERVVLRFERDFNDSWFTNYVAYNEISAYWDDRIGNRTGTHLGALVRFEDYEGEVSRDDLLLRGDAELSYFLRDWARLSVGVQVDQRASTAAGVDFTDFNAHFSALFTY